MRTSALSPRDASLALETTFSGGFLGVRPANGGDRRGIRHPLESAPTMDAHDAPQTGVTCSAASDLAPVGRIGSRRSFARLCEQPLQQVEDASNLGAERQ